MKTLIRPICLALFLMLGAASLLWAQAQMYSNGRGPRKADVLPFSDGKNFFVTIQGEDLDVRKVKKENCTCMYTSVGGAQIAWDNPQAFIHDYKKTNRVTLRFTAHRVDGNDGSGTITITITPTGDPPVTVAPINVEQETTFNPCG